MDRVDAVVIGAGVVGLAVARALALQGREVWVLEAANAIGTGTSARNSEVIHAGIYYPAGSLKARLCVQGKQMLYAYCVERGIGHQRCGNSPKHLQHLRQSNHHQRHIGNDVFWYGTTRSQRWYKPDNPHRQQCHLGQRRISTDLCST